MNDFLQSIRNGNFSKDNGNTGKPRYNNQQRPRRSYESNGNYLRNGNERKYRPRNQNDSPLMDDTLVTIKETLTAILANQEAGISFAERRAAAEERKADAFEFIAGHIASLTGDTFTPKLRSDDRPVEQSDDGETMKTDTNHNVSANMDSEKNATDMNKDDILEMIISMRNDGATYNEIASHLAGLNLPTFSGRGKWHAQTIHRLCQTA